MAEIGPCYLSGGLTMDKPKLIPCPFCGGTDIETGGTVLIGDKEKSWHVGCPDCGVWYDWLFRTEEEAIEAWNTRSGG